jgi:hypothetical protein
VTENSSDLGEERAPSPKIDTTVPQTARIWNYWLGGTDNYAVDRTVGDQIKDAFPLTVELARASRAFLARTVGYLAGEVGIRQFLDVGTGLPTANNTHEVAQAVDPECRIVYVDFDPLVLVYARALLTSSPEGATDYIDADARETGRILREADRTLDRTKPVAVMLLGILAHMDTYDQARSVIQGLMAGLPAGSYLVVNDGTDTSETAVEAIRIWNQSGKPHYHLRKPAQIAGYFDGLELVEPGVVPVKRWRPEPGYAGRLDDVDNYLGGVARKTT